MTEDHNEIETRPLSSLASSKRSLRRHHVNLERCQRLHLGLENEPMEFDATTLAAMVQDIANQCDEHEAFILHAVSRALTGDDEHHKLTLQHQKRGKFLSPTESEKRFVQDMNWLFTLANRENMGDQTEAGIAFIVELSGASRASIFAGIRRAETFLKHGLETFPDSPGAAKFENPRPANKRNT